MHKNAAKKIAEKLIEISQHVLPPGKGEGPFRGIWLHDGVVYSLPREQQGEFGELNRQFLKTKDWSEKFTDEYMSKKLKTIFADILREEKIDVEKQILSLADELDSFREKMTVYVPIVGISLEQDVEIGNIKLIKHSPENNQILEKKIKDVIEKTKHTAEEKAEYVNMFVRELENKLGGFTLAEFTVVAEPGRAYERAKEETRRVLEVLRFASKPIYGLAEDIRIGLKGEPAFSTRTSLVFSDKQMVTRGDKEGSVRSLEFNAESVKVMQEIGVFKVSDILKKKAPTNYEEVILRVIHWFSTGLKQAEIENAFLSMIIALETIFTAEKGNPITNTVAEGVALVLGTELEERKSLKKTIKQYYGMRSGVAHGGKKEIVQSDYLNLLNIVGSIIVVLIEKSSDFVSHQSFIDWVEELKLT